MVTPAAGGGVVVGDPLDAGRAAPAASRGDEELPPNRPGRMLDDKGGAPGIADARPAPEATANPARPVGNGRAERYEEDDGNSVPPPTAQAFDEPGMRSGNAIMSGADTPQPAPQTDSFAGFKRWWRGREEEVAAAPASQPEPAARPIVEPGDEPFPVAAADRPDRLRVGAMADDKGGFATPPPGFSNREQAEATAGRFPAGTVGPEDVDAPPAGAVGPAIPRGPNAAIEARGGRFEDGDERFGGGAGVGIQPAESIEIKRGSAEEVATTFLSLVAAGDLDRAKPLIAGRATGLLAKLRDGTATPEQIDELKTAAAVAQQENNRPKGGTHRLITYRADKKMLVLEAENKQEDAALVKLDVRNAPRRRN